MARGVGGGGDYSRDGYYARKYGTRIKFSMRNLLVTVSFAYVKLTFSLSYIFSRVTLENDHRKVVISAGSRGDPHLRLTTF